MIDKKIEAIRRFIVGIAEIRFAVKEDAKKIMESMPAAAVADEDSAADFMEELSTVLIRKHLINEKGRIVAPVAKLINDYVSAMEVNDDSF